MYRLLCLPVLLVALGTWCSGSDADFFFAVLADPQLGYWNPNEFPHEEAAVKLAVAELNRLKPRFVVVCGDLINRDRNEVETAAYRRLFGQLSPEIKLYNVPGNHDVSDEPGPSAQTLSYYRKNFGPDYYSFREGSLYGIVIDSTLMKHPLPSSEEASKQNAWLKAELAKAKSSGAVHIMIFQHHPWYIWYAEEDNHYYNMPTESRKEFLQIFKEAGVSHIFSGHYHGTRVVTYDRAIEMVTTASTAIPMFTAESGIRFVIVRNGQVDHRYFDFGSIPQVVDVDQGFAKVH
jgi:3',5'-cyclic AMP phosphodiesterase CpdA